jgi:replicative DNA helicase
MSEKKIATYPDNTYYRVRIAGDCTILPLRIKRKIPAARRQKKNITRTGLSVKSVGPGEYFGFQLDGDGRFLLGDFTVTHNSAVMLWWAEQFLKAGANVLYVTLEMSYEQTMERYGSVITGSNLSRVRNKRLSDDELSNYMKKMIAHSKAPEAQASFLMETDTLLDRTDRRAMLSIAKKYPDRKEKLFVLDIPKNCSPARVEREICRLSLEAPIHFVFVDYLNIMEPNFHSKDWVREQGGLAKDLKEVARKTGTIICTGAQLNTTNLNESSQITTDNLKYAKAICENSDWVIGFHRNQNDMLTKTMRLELAKHRSSAAAIAALEVDFETMQFLDLGDAADLPQADMTPGETKRAASRSWANKY